MAITWDQSRKIQRDNNDQPAVAATAYFFAAGTTTPLTVYEDADLTTPHDDPVVSDGYGRWPRVYIPYSVAGYRERVITAGGSELWDDDDIPAVDPVDTASSVDANQLINTGMVLWEPCDETRTGFVRLNGRSIGSATSGASERANSDTETLYVYNWNRMSDTLCPVATGRGASGAADFAANKALTLLDGRGAGLFGIDTMGNSAASLLGSAPVVRGSTILPGSVLGANTHTLTTAESPAHTHAISITTAAEGSHSHTSTTDAAGTHAHTATTTAGGGHSHTATTDSGGAHTHTGNGTTSGQSQSHTHALTTNYLFSASGPDNASFAVLRNSAGAENLGTSGNASQDHTHTISFTTDSGGAHTHTLTTTTQADHTHTLTTTTAPDHTHTLTTSTISAHTHTVTGTSASTGGGTAHNNLSRALLGTFFQKL